MGALEATDLRQWAAEQVDMAPHIDTLMRYAREARIVVEWGVRGGVSTWAILDALPEDGALYSVDIVDCIVPLRVSADPRWTFIVGNDLNREVQLDLEWMLADGHADLVFIDTSHTYEQTAGELAYAATLTPARIIMHDFVMEPVARAAYEFMSRENWRLVDNELPYGLATLEPL